MPSNRLIYLHRPEFQWHSERKWQTPWRSSDRLFHWTCSLIPSSKRKWLLKNGWHNLWFSKRRQYYLRLSPSKPCETFSLLSIGPTAAPTKKLKMAATMIAIRKFCAFDSHSMPTAQITIMIAKAMVPTNRVSLMPPSKIWTPYDSAITFIIKDTLKAYLSVITQKGVQWIAKTNSIHWSRHCIGKGKYDA